MPKFKHNCKGCKFLGTFHIIDEEDKDFYICGAEEEDETRTFLIKNSDLEYDYESAPLFCCAELTDLDKIALFGGLELAPGEEKALFRVLVNMFKYHLNVEDYKKYSLSGNLGRGNIVFKD